MKILHESFAPKKRDKTARSYDSLRWLKNLWEWWRPSPPTIQCSHKETTHFLNAFTSRCHREELAIQQSTIHSGPRLLKVESESRKPAEMTLGWYSEEDTHKQDTCTSHNYTSEFYPWQIHYKMGNRASKKQKQEASESQPLTNTPARNMYIPNLHLQVPI